MSLEMYWQFFTKLKIYLVIIFHHSFASGHPIWYCYYLPILCWIVITVTVKQAELDNGDIGNILLTVFVIWHESFSAINDPSNSVWIWGVKRSDKGKKSVVMNYQEAHFYLCLTRWINNISRILYWMDQLIHCSEKEYQQ